MHLSSCTTVILFTTSWFQIVFQSWNLKECKNQIIENAKQSDRVNPLLLFVQTLEEDAGKSSTTSTV